MRSQEVMLTVCCWRPRFAKHHRRSLSWTDTSFQFNFLSGLTALRCVIEDRLGRGADCDIEINPNFYAIEPKGAGKLLYGPRYALLRDEFASVRATRPPIRSSSRRVLVMMGGADPTHNTQVILQALRRINRPCSVRTLVGRGNRQVREVRATSDLLTNHPAEVFENANDVAEHMAWCDLAVSAAGSSCLELACIGVPALLLAVADNQRLVAQTLAAEGLMRSLGFHTQVTAEMVAVAIDTLLDDLDTRRTMVEMQRARVDGLGKTRVTARLMALTGNCG